MVVSAQWTDRMKSLKYDDEVVKSRLELKYHPWNEHFPWKEESKESKATTGGLVIKLTKTKNFMNGFPKLKCKKSLRIFKKIMESRKPGTWRALFRIDYIMDIFSKGMLIIWMCQAIETMPVKKHFNPENPEGNLSEIISFVPETQPRHHSPLRKRFG